MDDISLEKQKTKKIDYLTELRIKRETSQENSRVSIIVKN